MMNYHLPYLPERDEKPRKKGLCMLMDKGASVGQAKELIDSAAHLVDFVKLGFGTSIVTNKLQEKINLYKEANIKVYFGGTLFEAFIIRGMFDEYEKLLQQFGLECVEVSDGSMSMEVEEKCQYISKLSEKYLVLSEVGSKVADVSLTSEEWINNMDRELKAGAEFVIAESRESGTVGIYHSDGSADVELIEKIHESIPENKIIWEAPAKSQQAWLIKHFGANVNLGNIAYNEIHALETLRLGLRGDTFFEFLPDNLKNRKKK